MDKETTTSVTIDRKTFARLDRLAKSNNVSKKDFLSCALEYFEKYGINPVEHESPAKEMQKLIKRCDQVIAFIRKQEQDFLRPACEAMGSTSMRVTMSMDSILTEKKFSQYQKDNDLFMRDLASLAGIREVACTSSASRAGVKLARTFSKMISLLVMAFFLSGLGGLYTVPCCLLWLECNTVPCKCQAFFLNFFRGWGVPP